MGTMERIVGEPTTTAAPKHPATTMIEQATGIENMFQALSEAVQACVQARVKENKRFWTYLHYLEAQKHQFSLYMKGKDTDFPDLLLQQFNFG